jgi:hypothetical protein
MMVIRNRLGFDEKVKVLRWIENHKTEIEGTGMTKHEVAKRASADLGIGLLPSHITGVNTAAKINFAHGGNRTKMSINNRAMFDQVLRISREIGVTLNDEFRILCEREGLVNNNAG